MGAVPIPTCEMGKLVKNRNLCTPCTPEPLGCNTKIVGGLKSPPSGTGKQLGTLISFSGTFKSSTLVAIPCSTAQQPSREGSHHDRVDVGIQNPPWNRLRDLHGRTCVVTFVELFDMGHTPPSIRRSSCVEPQHLPKPWQCNPDSILLASLVGWRPSLFRYLLLYLGTCLHCGGPASGQTRVAPLAPW